MITVLPDSLKPGGQYGAKAACECLGISDHTLRRWVAAGYIKKRVHKVNGRMVFRGDDLIALWHATRKG